MLLKFTVENFLSFQGRTEFSMVAGKGTRHSEHIIKSKNKNGFNLLKASIIYGANASGKSNLIKAINFAKKLVLEISRAGTNIEYHPFKLNSKNEHSPSRFEFEIKIGESFYAYGFSVDADCVHEEWLYKVDKKSEQLIFERSSIGDNAGYVFGFTDKSPKSEHSQFLQFTAKGTPRNRLFLSEFNERGVFKEIPELIEIENVFRWFKDRLVIIFPNSKHASLEYQLHSNRERAEEISNVLKSFDTGISGLSVQERDAKQAAIEIPSEIMKLLSELPEGEVIMVNGGANSRYLAEMKDKEITFKKLMTSHKNEKGETRLFDLTEESDGTRRLVDLSPGILDAISNEKVYLIDEIDRSLHPEITLSIIAAFLKNESKTPSQLIVTTHETNLLNQDLIRKDEVWFTQKGNAGNTTLYSLQEFKPRFDKDLRRAYLAGRFGGVPLLKNCLDFSMVHEDA